MSGFLSVQEALGASGAEYFGEASALSRRIEDFSIDSRSAAGGALFVPIKGERTDGHLHIGEAFARGAAASLVDRAFWLLHADSLRAEARRFAAGLLVVDSGLAALQLMAERHMRSLPAFTIGITGSNGKTTTKEMIGAILGQDFQVAVNEGNFNSEIGLPLAALRVGPAHRMAVFEMGMNRAGEMDILARIVRPQAALITNVGSAHVGRLGSREAIAHEKKKIFARLGGSGRGYVYENEPWREFLSRDVEGEIRLYGEKSTPGFEGVEERGLAGSILAWNGLRINLALPGRHSVRNALGAISLCRDLGCSAEAVRRGLEQLRPLFGRGQILSGRVSAILDCYNANYESMESALRFLAETAWPGRRCVVLGSMMELGREGPELHAALGRLLAGLGLDACFLFGAEMAPAVDGLRAAGYGGTLLHTDDFAALESALRDFMVDQDLFLLKGSRSMALERLSHLFAPGRA